MVASAAARLASAVLLSAAAFGAEPLAAPKPAANNQPFPPADARRAAGTRDTPEVLALLRQRRDVVQAELDLARKSLGDPNLPVDVWSALAERLLVAETDLAEEPADRIAAYRTFRDNLKLMEDQLQHVAEPARGQGYFEYGQKLWIHARRLQAEAALLRAEAAKGEPATGVDDSPGVRQALVAWRDAARTWAKMWLESRILLIPPFAREIATTTLAAELAAAKDHAEEIAAYQAFRDRLLVVEKDTKAEVEKRRYNAFDYLRIKEMRCDADVVLGRLKAGGGKALEKDPPEVRTALDDWVETIGFESAVLRKRYDSGKIPPAESLLVDESLLTEELAAATRPAEQIAAYRKFLGKLKEAEAALKARATENAAAKEDAARATYNRATAERTVLQLLADPGSKPSPELKALLKEQRAAVRVQLEFRMAEWSAGQGDFQLLQESAGHLLLAELELAAAPADRVAAYQAHVDRMRSAESQAKLLLEAKKGPEIWSLWTRGARLEAEVWFLRSKRNLTGNSNSTPSANR